MECSNARHAYLSFTNGSSAGFLECRTPGRADRYLNFQCKLVERDRLNDFNKLMQLFKFIGVPYYVTLDKEGNVLNKCLEFDTPEAFAEQLRKIKESER